MQSYSLQTKSISKLLVLLAFLLFSPALDNARAMDLSLRASSTSVQVGSSIQMTLNVEGGTPPYTYKWDFDDVDSYENPVSTQNPSHTFRWPGRHYVRVQVTDSVGEKEEAIAIIDVAIGSSVVSVNAISDCGCDSTGQANCTPNLHSCIQNNLGSSGQIKIEFPPGTYRFMDKTCYNVPENERVNQCGIDISGTNPGGLGIKGISFVGTGFPRATLRYVGNTNGSGAYDDAGLHRHSFVQVTHLTSAPSYDTIIHFSNLKMEMEKSPDDYVLYPRLVYGVDNYSQRIYLTMEDCDLRRFGGMGHYNRAIHRRNNIAESGHFHNNEERIEVLRYRLDGLCVRNYFTNLGDNHSHVWYFTGCENVYVIDNYADLGDGSANGGQLKMGIHKTKVSGNLIRNIDEGAGLTLGGVDGQAYDTEYSDNRIINSEIGIILHTCSSNIRFTNNFFSDIEYHVITAGTYGACVRGLDVAGLSIENNISGYLAPSRPDRFLFYKCNYEDCDPARSCGATLSNNVNDSSRHKEGDPAGWYNQTGYLDPGEYEYVPPVVNSFVINNGAAATRSRSVTLTMDVTDAGSGMYSDARFPYRKGALMQFSNDGSTWHQVEPYAATHSWVLSEGNGEKKVYGRFRDVDGNWSAAVQDSISLSGDSLAPSAPENLREDEVAGSLKKL